MTDRRDEAGPVQPVLDETALGLARMGLFVEMFERHEALPLLLPDWYCTEMGWRKRKNGRPYSNERPSKLRNVSSAYWKA
jgi:hypothetical protein